MFQRSQLFLFCYMRARTNDIDVQEKFVENIFHNKLLLNEISSTNT